MVHQYETLSMSDRSIALPITPILSPQPPSGSSSSSPSLRRTRFRPTLPTLSLALIHISFFLWWTHQARPTLDAAHSIISTHKSAASSSSSDNVDVATGSCEVCIVDPGNELCEYGMNSVRMSRQYEGSGVRVRRMLEKALRGEAVGIGILGASVTAGEYASIREKNGEIDGLIGNLFCETLRGLFPGHSVLPGQQKWQEKFYDDFLTLFPTAKMHVGAVSATDSRFFSYCHEAVVPQTLDLYIVELDINNNPYVTPVSFEFEITKN